MSGEICRFFLNNSCRYGDRCRYRHDYPDRNRYVYVKPQSPAQKSPPSFDLDNPAVINECLAHLAVEAKQVELSGIWPLTCLGFKSYGNLPGWEDFSPEESRWQAYEALLAGRYPQYLADMDVLRKRAAEARMIFIKPGNLAASILKSMAKEERPTDTKVTSLFAKSQPPASAASTFSFSLQGNPGFNRVQQSAFGVKNDPAPGLFSMAAQVKPPPSTSIFGQPLNSAAASNFSFTQFRSHQPTGFNQTQMNVDDGQVAKNFGQPTANAQNFSFAQTPANQSQQPFFSLETPQTTFNQSIFGGASQRPSFITSTPLPSFTQKPSAFDRPAAQSGNVELKIYSKTSNLSEVDLEQFKAPTFTFKCVPVQPPPKELCT